jgi:hypothetical protein
MRAVKPRMVRLSPWLPASPAARLMPDTLRRASLRVVVPWLSRTSRETTVIDCGVSFRGAAYLSRDETAGALAVDVDLGRWDEQVQRDRALGKDPEGHPRPREQLPQSLLRCVAPAHARRSHGQDRRRGGHHGAPRGPGEGIEHASRGLRPGCRSDGSWSSSRRGQRPPASRPRPHARAAPGDSPRWCTRPACLRPATGCGGNPLSGDASP